MVSRQTLNLAAEIHASLVKLVAPATPDSIRASSLKPWRNLTLFFISAAALAALASVVVGNAVSFCESSALPSPVEIPPVCNTALPETLRILGGAALGSAFYSLYTATNYIQAGTFDPKYNSIYLIRFGLGLLAGSILAYVLKDYVGAVAKDDPAAKVGASALALIGGYSAEAVVKILDRISETLVTLVAGSEKDKAAAEAEKKTTKALSDTVKKLQQGLNDNTPGALEKVVQEAMQDILTRK